MEATGGTLRANNEKCLWFARASAKTGVWYLELSLFWWVRVKAELVQKGEGLGLHGVRGLSSQWSVCHFLVFFMNCWRSE